MSYGVTFLPPSESAVDDLDTADESTAITFQATGLTTRSAAVTIADDDTQAIVVSATAPLTLIEGDSTTFTVRLAFDPAGTATVDIATSDSGAAIASPTTLTFTSGSFSTPQTVTVAGVTGTAALYLSGAPCRARSSRYRWRKKRGITPLPRSLI